MLTTLLLIAAAHSPAQCEIRQSPAVPPAAVCAPGREASGRHGLLERLSDRRHDRRARRDPSSIDRTLAKFFRSLRHRRAERRGHRSPRLLERIRDRRGRPRNPDQDLAGPGQVTVPHEDPVDLPLYPQPND